MIKVAYVTGTRADFGLMVCLLSAIDRNPMFKLLIFPTGMHLLKEFGTTVNEIKDKFRITQIIETTYKNDNRLAMATFVGNCTVKVAGAFSFYKPNIALVLGDRGEQLASAIAATYLNIPIIHMHGGEISGTVDNPVRQAISRLATFHLVASKKSAQHLLSTGINHRNIFVVGAPGIEEIKALPKLAKKRRIIVLQHPAENENQAGKQMEITLKAISSFGLPTFIIYPNADAGGRRMIKVINEFAKKFSFIKTFPSLKRPGFLKLLAQSEVLVGNSSAGLIEAPSLCLPVVNIGERQKSRERTKNVIDVNYNIREIQAAIKKSLYDKNFQASLKRIKNPYEQSQTTEKILKLVEKFI